MKVSGFQFAHNEHMKPWCYLILLSLKFVEVAAQPSNQSLIILPGVVIDTVRCDTNQGQSYAAYVPKNYNASLTWPVIFFYEPATRGSLPVTLYQSQAEKYQCILIGSNNSRNGPFSASEQAEDAIFLDVSKRFSVDKSKLFISGFSGGARAAVHLALRRKKYAGIIACGAAFPDTDKLTDSLVIPFVELIGHLDFNFVEAIETNDYLNRIQYPHSLILFQGTHDWPHPEIYDQAIFWQLSTQYKIDKSGITDSMIHLNESFVLSRVKSQLDSGDVYLARLSIQQAIAAPSRRSAKIDSLDKMIEANSQLEKQQKEFNNLLIVEVQLRENFYGRFFRLVGAVNDSLFKESEWHQFIGMVKQRMESRNRLEAQMGERVYQCMRIACYERFRKQRDDQDHFHAVLTMRLLTLLENNEVVYFLMAREYAAMKKKKEAIRALSKSIDLGLKDKKLIEKNREFDFLTTEKKFNALLHQLDLNSNKN